MPFTPSHVVAVLPLIRWRRALRLDTTCLAIGSMAPDFEYFVHGRLGGDLGHTTRGLVLWCLPVTLILATLYHWRVKWLWLVVAPARVTARLLEPVGRPWRARWSPGAALSCAVSAVLGGITHLWWDGVTHAQGYTATHVRALYQVVAVPVIGELPMFRVLQHVSSVIGLAILGGLFARAWPRWPVVALPAVSRWAPRVALVAGSAIAVALLSLRVLHSRRFDVGDVVVAVISGLLLASLATSLVVRGAALRSAVASADRGVTLAA